MHTNTFYCATTTRLRVFIRNSIESNSTSIICIIVITFTILANWNDVKNPYLSLMNAGSDVCMIKYYISDWTQNKLVLFGSRNKCCFVYVHHPMSDLQKTRWKKVNKNKLTSSRNKSLDFQYNFAILLQRTTPFCVSNLNLIINIKWQEVVVVETGCSRSPAEDHPQIAQTAWIRLCFISQLKSTYMYLENWSNVCVN